MQDLNQTEEAVLDNLRKAWVLAVVGGKGSQELQQLPVAAAIQFKHTIACSTPHTTVSFGKGN